MIAAPVARAGWLRAVPPRLPSQHRYWLLRPGALTAGLRALGHMRLRVLREYAAGLAADEASALGLAPRTPVWVREIVMSVDGVDCVAARSLTPLAASHGIWQGMRRLRTRPLADMLYHDRSVSRSPFACARLHRRIALYRTALRVLENRDHPDGAGGSLACGSATAASLPALWARRSVFLRGGQPLLVAECFLPDFWPIAGRSQPR